MLKREIKHKGYTIKIAEYGYFDVLGNYDTGCVYTAIDGIIHKVSDGYEMGVYLKTNKYIHLLDNKTHKSFNQAINWIKHIIDIFIIQNAIELSNKNKFYCNFEYNLIHVNNLKDVRNICNTLKSNNINFNVETAMLNTYCIKVFKNIVSNGDNTITIR